MIVVRLGSFPSDVRPGAATVRCPGETIGPGGQPWRCNHRLFSAIFVGVIEVRCPRCKGIFVVTNCTPPDELPPDPQCRETPEKTVLTVAGT